MSGEIQLPFQAGQTLYAIVRNATAQVWNSSGAGAFESYATANYDRYTVSLVEQGTASQHYVGTFPAAIPAGLYNMVAKRQVGASAVEGDPVVGSEGAFHWNGTIALGLSALATQEQVSQFSPIRVARGVMITNFLFKLVSLADSNTSLLSGSVSGQISRDGGAFTALQSGLVTEVGLGHYKVTLTSGDLLGNTAALVFTADGAAQRDFNFVLQRTSGQ